MEMSFLLKDSSQSFKFVKSEIQHYKKKIFENNTEYYQFDIHWHDIFLYFVSFNFQTNQNTL